MFGHFLLRLRTTSLLFGGLGFLTAGCGVTLNPVTLEITPARSSLEPKSALQLHAMMTLPSGTTTDVTSQATWSTSNAAVATISKTGVLTALSPGPSIISASLRSANAKAVITVNATSPGAPGDGGAYPISVYKGADLSTYPIFDLAKYAASGSKKSTTCTGHTGSVDITCSELTDFKVGQGVRVVGGGPASVETAILDAPLVSKLGSTAGAHTYCYVVATVDPLGGISAPSPQTCVSGEPDLSLATATNSLTTTTSNVGPSPAFLWYVSEDGGPYSLLNVAKFISQSGDVGQRVGSRGGWPDKLPASNPDISKSEDLFSTVKGVSGNHLILADALATSATGNMVDHDDTQAVESAILDAVAAGGGTITFRPGTFNIRRPAFAYVVDNSFAYPPYTTDISMDPWWAAYCALYIPNGARGNINLQGAGRATTLVSSADHGGVASLLAVGNEQREGAVGTPILRMQEVVKGVTQIQLESEAAASTLTPGDDIFIYSGSIRQTPDGDINGIPDLNHFSEINTVASISGNRIRLVYPTSKRYFDDGGSTFGLTKLPVTPHNIEIQHLSIEAYEPITATGDVFGMLINDVSIQGSVSPGAFGGGFKRGVTIENSSWTFGQGMVGWAQTDEYDQCTDYAFLDNVITGFAAPGSEGSSGMAKIYASQGTSQVLFMNNTFDHVSLYADQTTEYYVQNNTFTDGIVAAGVAYGAYTRQYDPLAVADRSFLSFDSQETLSIDHNEFTITPEFNPPWVIRAGDFSSGTISNNSIRYSGGSPWFVIASFNGNVLNNTISVQSPQIGEVMVLVPDQSPITPTSSFTAQGNNTTANIIAANIFVADPGFTDSAPVCIGNNLLQVSQGSSTDISPSIINHSCL